MTSPRRFRIPVPSTPVVVVIATVLFVLAGAALWRRSVATENTVSLADAPKGVTVVEPRVTTWRPKKRFVGTLKPLLEARIGPQLTAAMVDTVLVRPGQRVKKGDVLATLDCRNASASRAAVSAQARALQARQLALQHETERTAALVDGGFVSLNDVEQRQASVSAAMEQLAAVSALQDSKSLEVNDCVMRAPFSGEISSRLADPGTFVRPGSIVVTLIDRSTLRLAFEVPEVDFSAVQVGTPLQLSLLANGAAREVPVARVSPEADPITRTLHVEADLGNDDGALPAGTTSEVFVEVGTPRRVTQVPLVAARVKGNKATVFVVEADKAYSREFTVVGEQGAHLFVDAEIPAETRIVTEGRSQLRQYDLVKAQLEVPSAMTAGGKP
ncbi:MAG: efflux RND transporter periplasmic adaptor subunit [Archangium sp.]